MNVILIVCDTLRADHLGCYGYFRQTSPNIDKIAEEGVLFQDFYNSGVPTGPGFTSIFTGLHPIKHKYYVFNDLNCRQVDDRIVTLAEMMQSMGLTTVAVDTLINMYGRGKHWVRGYEYYLNSTKNPFRLPCAIWAEENNKKLFEWLDNHCQEEFFMFVHYWDPHLPYNLPKEYRQKFQHKKGSVSDLEVKDSTAGYKYVPGWGEVDHIPQIEESFIKRRQTVDLYDGEIFYMDKEIGNVMNVLREKEILDNTAIIVTSDHGEELGQHYGIWTHGSLHAAVTHIPFIIRYPNKLPRGHKVEGFCQQIDIVPTILDLFDVPLDANKVLKLDGSSTIPIIGGEAGRSPIFIESGGSRAVRNKDWLLIDHSSARTDRRHRELELYNVENDPMEIKNLAKNEPEQVAKIKNILENWVSENLEECEKDPAKFGKYIYEGENSRQTHFEYRDMTRKLVESLIKNRVNTK